MHPDLVARYAAPVPRYTSYPTAPHFHAGVGPDDYVAWLGEHDGPLSLYLHVPFCDRLCWYCGCHTKQVKRYDPLATYLDALLLEVGLVAAALRNRRKVIAIHFGGGSPTMIAPKDLLRLRQALDNHFDIAENCEISVEIDPGFVDEEKLTAWRDFGVTRASIGVQDFDEAVQKAINRPQSFEQTAFVVQTLRKLGINGVNLDIVYGLPHQTMESVARTIELSLAMQPDRFAIFGYAHVPWMKKHQTLIDEQALPGIQDRFAMAGLVAERLEAAGYLAIGIDHFARPGDSLATALEAGEVHRNFQGYTTDAAPGLVGLGASSIGKVGRGYVQNIVATGEYMRTVRQGRLPVLRGKELTDIDRVVGAAIEDLMCNYAFSVSDLERRFGSAAAVLRPEAAQIHQQDGDGMTAFDGDVFSVTPQGRTFVRTIASRFDRYFGQGAARHSVAV
ncbi:oxygen-independent coproporphyrinogen III oxidase [Neorhizobium sp. JUb45]|uniref:oxygen-independent coproporphyrinogen III oxidase n=1 Tax=unclassified Neorhizobium TaxID=2629175 RepID=UPI0010432197|nr:oxygen-independent coproporphyrinogen III oxidase [Neorhizobium sp. JUb45]TCR02090.1 anaerobic coproporphyrinogen III oxidase [Neorhizobium sp. JUb45]